MDGIHSLLNLIFTFMFDFFMEQSISIMDKPLV